MIERYSYPRVGQFHSQQALYSSWLDVTLAVVDARAKLGDIPEHIAQEIRQKATFSPEGIAERERRLRHDFISFLEEVSAHVGKHACYLHEGLTSSDVIDTALSVRLRASIDEIVRQLDQLLARLGEKARAYGQTICIGRTHGIHAEPTTIGLKFAGFYAEFMRNRERLLVAKKEISVCAISGAVGTFATICPQVQTLVAQHFHLAEETISTQVIPRDRHAAVVSAFALTVSAIERMCVEIRHLQRTEVREVEEGFADEQKGSSAMPHKKNPILSENLSGLARTVRAYITTALENIALWHERDISHSSSERIIFPHVMELTGFMLDRATDLVSKLRVIAPNVDRNVQLTRGLIFSQKLMLALVQKGMDRPAAYTIVQQIAMQTWESPHANFVELARQHPDICARISPNELIHITDLHAYTRYAQQIIDKTLAPTSF